MIFSRKNVLVFLLTAILIVVAFLLWPVKENIANFNPVVQKEISAKIMFVGDLMFDRGIRYYASKNGGNTFIFEKINPLLLENDLVVANLEGPITDNKSISLGTIPGSTNNYYFTFNPSLVKNLFDNNIKIVNLGNNHIENFKREGVYSTEKYLDEGKIGYFNAPNGPRSVSTKINDIKVTFVGYNQFSALAQKIEEKSTIEEIEKAKGFSDIIIVYSHWGEEYLPNPTPAVRNTAHNLIDAGADLVIGSHSHVIGEIETYKNKKIYYSLGNFIFDQHFDENVRNGLGVVVQIKKDAQTSAFELNFEEKHFYLESSGQTIIKE